MPDRLDAPAVAVRTDDWPGQAADAIVNTVGKVRDATTTKAITAAKTAVYGILVAIAGLTLAILFVTLLVRLLDDYLPDAWFGDAHTWAAHLLIGVVFSLVGLGLLRMARRAPSAEDS